MFSNTNKIKKIVKEEQKKFNEKLKKIENQLGFQQEQSKICVENGNKIGREIINELQDLKNRMSNLESLLIIIVKNNNSE